MLLILYLFIDIDTLKTIQGNFEYKHLLNLNQICIY
jgi:hypothetical protein